MKMFLAFVAFSLMFVNSYGVKADDGEDRACADIEPGWCVNTDIIDVDVCPDNPGLWCVAVQTTKEPMNTGGGFALTGAGTVVYTEEKAKDEQVTIEVKKYLVVFPDDIEFWLGGERSSIFSAENSFYSDGRVGLIKHVVSDTKSNGGIIDRRDGEIRFHGFNWYRLNKILSYTMDRNQIVFRTEVKKVEDVSASLFFALFLFAAPCFLIGLWTMRKASLLKTLAKWWTPEQVAKSGVPQMSWLRFIFLPITLCKEKTMLSWTCVCVFLAGIFHDDEPLLAWCIVAGFISSILWGYAALTHVRREYKYFEPHQLKMGVLSSLAVFTSIPIWLAYVMNQRTAAIFVASAAAFWLGGLITGIIRRAAQNKKRQLPAPVVSLVVE